MTGRPQPQYLRGVVRQRAQRVLFDMPEWARVRIRGSEPSEIRSAEQLVSWVESYGKAIGKLLAEHAADRAGLAGFSAVGETLAAVHPCGVRVSGRSLVELAHNARAHRCPHEHDDAPVEADERDVRERAAGDDT